MIRSVFMILVALVTALMPSALHADVTGSASVIDGDTIEIHGQRIRLHGIDAPESPQLCQAEGKNWRCGQQASLALDGKIAGRPVSCRQKDVDVHRRIVAICFAGNENLNAWMVAEGWALAYRQHSTEFVRQEQAANTSHRGIWRGSFVPPWDWRSGQQLAAANDAKPGQCPIKGNVSSKGERIYHVPGGQFYDRTQVNPANGERWFCTEAEARAAGWRRSRR